MFPSVPANFLRKTCSNQLFLFSWHEQDVENHGFLLKPEVTGSAGPGWNRARQGKPARPWQNAAHIPLQGSQAYTQTLNRPPEREKFLRARSEVKENEFEEYKEKNNNKTGQRRLTLKYPEQFIASKVNTFSFPQDLSFPSVVCTLLKGKYLFRNYNRKNKDPPLLPLDG